MCWGCSAEYPSTEPPERLREHDMWSPYHQPQQPNQHLQQPTTTTEDNNRRNTEKSHHHNKQPPYPEPSMGTTKLSQQQTNNHSPNYNNKHPNQKQLTSQKRLYAALVRKTRRSPSAPDMIECGMGETWRKPRPHRKATKAKTEATRVNTDRHIKRQRDVAARVADGYIPP